MVILTLNSSFCIHTWLGGGASGKGEGGGGGETEGERRRQALLFVNATFVCLFTSLKHLSAPTELILSFLF